MPLNAVVDANMSKGGDVLDIGAVENVYGPENPINYQVRYDTGVDDSMKRIFLRSGGHERIEPQQSFVLPDGTPLLTSNMAGSTAGNIQHVLDRIPPGGLRIDVPNHLQTSISKEFPGRVVTGEGFAILYP